MSDTMHGNGGDMMMMSRDDEEISELAEHGRERLLKDFQLYSCLPCWANSPPQQLAADHDHSRQTPEADEDSSSTAHDRVETATSSSDTIPAYTSMTPTERSTSRRQPAASWGSGSVQRLLKPTGVPSRSRPAATTRSSSSDGLTPLATNTSSTAAADLSMTSSHAEAMDIAAMDGHQEEELEEAAAAAADVVGHRHRHILQLTEEDDGGRALSKVERLMLWPLNWLSPAWRQRVIWMWALLGLTLIGVLVAVLWENGKRSHLGSLSRQCEQYADFAETQFNNTATALCTTADLIRSFYFEGDESLADLATFQAFMRPSLESLPIAAVVGFVLFVPGNMRPAVESAIGRCFFEAPQGPGSCLPVAENYTILLLHATIDEVLDSLQGTLLPGMDVAGAPFASSIHRAADLPLGAVTPPFPLLNDNSPSFVGQAFSVRVNKSSRRNFEFSPRQQGGGKGNATDDTESLQASASSPDGPHEDVELVGATVIVYNFWSLSKMILHRVISSNLAADIYDSTDENNMVLLYSNFLNQSSDMAKIVAEAKQRKKEADVRAHFPSCHQIFVADYSRVITVHCRFFKDNYVPIAAIVWLVLLFVSLALSVFFLCTAEGFMKKLERDYERMASVRDRMREAKLMAEAASHAKGEFLTTMSHEIRTPMNGVIGMLNLLLQTPLNAMQEDYVETAQTSGRALCALMSDILDLSKIESEQLRLEKRLFDLRSEIDDVLALFVDQAGDKGQVELAAVVADDVPMVMLGDALRIRQVLINLLSNAMKFTHYGHVLLAARLALPGEDLSGFDSPPQEGAPSPAHSSPTSGLDTSPRGIAALHAARPAGDPHTLSGMATVDGPCSWPLMERHLDAATCGSLKGSCQFGQGQSVRLVLSVEDTGLGIPSSARGHLFSPFSQAELSTSRLHGGTGIGLSICQRLISMMGGSISFASKSHVGTTFFFDIFLEAQQDPNPCLGPPAACRGHLAPAAAASGLQGAAALVVDDRPVRMAVTLSHLRRLGMRPIFCSSFEGIPSAMASLSEPTASPFASHMLIPRSASADGKILPSQLEMTLVSHSTASSVASAPPSSLALHILQPLTRLASSKLPQQQQGGGGGQSSSDSSSRGGQAFPTLTSLASFLRPAAAGLNPTSPKGEASKSGFLSAMSSFTRAGQPVAAAAAAAAASAAGLSPRSSESGSCSTRAVSPQLDIGERRLRKRRSCARSGSFHALSYLSTGTVGAVLVEKEMMERQGVSLAQLSELVRTAPGSFSPIEHHQSGVAPPLVLLVTGSMASSNSSREFGCDAVLRKPLRRAGVSACLLSVMPTIDDVPFADVELDRKTCRSGSNVGFEKSPSLSPTSLQSPLTSHTSPSKSQAGKSPRPSLEGQSEVLVVGVEQEDPLTQLQGKRLLVVDDNLINRKVIKKMLERYGAQVTAVDGGKKAVEELKPGHDYFMVFMDLQMPEMDGIEATKTVRSIEKANPSASRVPILALTADVIAGTKERCLEAGMDVYLTKPIEEHQLLHALHTLSPLIRN